MRARQMMGIILALFWLPITSHCLLERLSGLEFLSCCTHEAEPCDNEEKDCATDACAVVEEGFYKVQDNGDLLPERVFDSSLTLPDIFLADTVRRLPDLRLAFSPPDLPAIWRFTTRASLPIRAPSLT